MQDIPDHAEIVFQGVRCTIYHWNQVMYDGTTRVFEAVTRPPSATIIATKDNQIAFQRQTQPHRDEYFLCLPGGWADVEGEVIEDTAKRELLEETGLVSDDWELWKVAGVNGFIHWDNYIYIARNCRETGEVRLDGGEQIENGFVSLDEFLSLVDHPQFRHRDLIQDLYRIRDNREARENFQKLLGIH